MEQNKRVVVITGASSGIGRATAIEFAMRGDKLVLAARRLVGLEEVAEECEHYGAEVVTFPFDVSHEEEVNSLARTAYDHFGRIDVWVNNAAVAMMGPFMETPMEDIKRLMDINVMGYLYGARAVLPYFQTQGHGNLINVSSIAGITGQPFSVAYATSKFAIRGMSLSLRQELIEDKDIHVCTVLPATVDTPLFESAANYMGREVKAMSPVVDAKEVADEIVSLSRNPKPEVIVGGMGIKNTLMKYLAPDLFAKMYHKQVEEDHFREEREGPKRGNLYQPNFGNTSVKDGWVDGRSRAAKMSSRNIMWMGAAVVGAVAGTAALLLKGRDANDDSMHRDPSSPRTRTRPAITGIIVEEHVTVVPADKGSTPGMDKPNVY